MLWRKFMDWIGGHAHLCIVCGAQSGPWQRQEGSYGVCNGCDTASWDAGQRQLSSEAQEQDTERRWMQAIR